jgi:hypothetical protein
LLDVMLSKSSAASNCMQMNCIITAQEFNLIGLDNNSLLYVFALIYILRYTSSSSSSSSNT